jgi:hypothetical protein
MKRLMVILTIILVTFSAAYAIHQTMPAETMVPLPGPHASAIYKYITVEDNYRNWTLWPGKGKKYKARPPLEIVTTYLNENAYYSLRIGEKMANGSIIVTENYDKNGNLNAIFLMYKIKGYNPEAGNWYWAQYDHDGRTKAAGKVSACIDCHSKVKNNDYVFTEPFVK